MRVLTTVLEVAGAALILFGAALVGLPALLIVGGLGLVLLSWRLSL